MALNEVDLQLVRRLRRSADPRAIDSFFNEFFPRLYRFVLPRVAGDHDVAQEMCQQALIRGLEHLDGYRGEASLYTWFCQIARNCMSDWWTRQRREAARVVFFEDDAAIRAAVESIEIPSAELPEARNSRAELVRLIHVALDQLPARHRAALELKYLEGLQVDAIAARMGESFMATQSLLARARGAFRATFSALAGNEMAALLPDLGGPGSPADG